MQLHCDGEIPLARPFYLSYFHRILSAFPMTPKIAKSGQFPFDSNIVRLKTVDYINASWISDLLPGFRDRLIVTIGPMHPDNFSDHPDTCGDFWGMVAELGVRTVIMLGAGEKGYAGCARYFPDKEEEEVNFGKFDVRVLERTKVGDHAVIRKLRLKVIKKRVSKLICQ